LGGRFRLTSPGDRFCSVQQRCGAVLRCRIRAQLTKSMHASDWEVRTKAIRFTAVLLLSLALCLRVWMLVNSIGLPGLAVRRSEPDGVPGDTLAHLLSSLPPGSSVF
jgi:hypothetical protein